MEPNPGEANTGASSARAATAKDTVFGGAGRPNAPYLHAIRQAAGVGRIGEGSEGRGLTLYALP